MKKAMKERGIILILTSLFVISVIFILAVNTPRSITGFATQVATVSNVTISKYLSIDMSTNLSAGILYGNVSSLPASNLNASHNYDGNNSTSSMFINVSVDSNTRVDVCIKSNQDLYDSSGGNIIGIGNETYSNSTTTDLGIPGFASEVGLNKSNYIKAGQNISQGGANYYRFWLDIPAGTASGTYNNSVMFEGVEVNTAC